MSLTRYFSRKRNLSSTSDSDTSVVVGDSDQHVNKRTNFIAEEEPCDMSVQEALEKINKRLDSLASLATKEDMDAMKAEVKTLTDTFMKKIGELEGRMLELEAKADSRDRAITSLTKKNEELQNAVRGQELRVQQTQREINDLQQYSRRWNVRVYRVPEAEGEQMEDCIKKVCHIFSQDVGITTSPSDIEVAHRAGQRSSNKARPILVRFFDRKKRDSVIINRRKLKNKGVVIGEDLTFENYKLSTAAHRHTATMSVWSVNGKVYAKLKNGLTMKLNIHMNLDETFRRALTSSNVISDTE